MTTTTAAKPPAQSGNHLVGLYDHFARFASKWQSPLLLLVRLYIGYQCVISGYAHITHFHNTVEAFKGWHIPAPEVNVALSALTEIGAGGLFLLAKSVLELHASVEHPRSGPAGGARLANSFAAVLLQIAVLDLVFSLDSVFTAVGLAQRFEIMVAAIVLAALLMMLVVHQVSALIERHPTIKVLALGFLILIGVALLAEALEFHIPKAYLYFAMAFALGVEVINLRVRRSPASGVPPAGAG